jgi:SAM-dependent methyltransferase
MTSVPDYPPEISDLIVDFDPASGDRRAVLKADVVATFRRWKRRAAVRVVRRIPADDDGFLDPNAVDDLLVRVHAEIQRLSEEFMQAKRLHGALEPLIRAMRSSGVEPPYRVVDVGCGTGYLVRWLAANGDLGDDVELIGTDYNVALVRRAQQLAAAEKLDCHFVVRNAFQLDDPATIFTSIGVVHHFRGDDLTRFLAQQVEAGALAFLHFDIRPSYLAPLGAWIFHVARMQEPLAHHDGVLSAVRAHPSDVLLGAARHGAPSFTSTLFDEDHGLVPVLKVMHGLVGVEPRLFAPWREALGDEVGRLDPVAVPSQ